MPTISISLREKAGVRAKANPLSLSLRERAGVRAYKGNHMTTSTNIGQKLWNYCNVLRDAGLSYGDYLEQLTYLIFLKMMHERSRPPYTLLSDYQPPPIPRGHDWPSLLARDGNELETHYRRTLESPRTPARYHRSHLREGPEQDPRAGDADPAHQGADRQRKLACPQRRRQGRRLRVTARTQRAGREDRRRPVLHASSPDSGHRRCPAAPAGH